MAEHAPTALSLSNLALGKCGYAKLSAFSDGNAEATWAIDAFLEVLEGLLVDQDWYFARAREDLSDDKDASVENLTDYDYAYDLPADFLEVRDLRPGPATWIVEAPAGEARHLYCSLDVNTKTSTYNYPMLIYTRTVGELDGSSYPALKTAVHLPPKFREVLVLRLAADCARNLKKDTGLATSLMQEFFTELRKAVGVHALANPGDSNKVEFWGPRGTSKQSSVTARWVK